MQNKWYLFLLLFIAIHGAGQYNPSSINKKAVQYYNQANERLDDGNINSATGLLQQAIEADKNYVDAYLTLAAIHGKLKNYKSAVLNYEKAFAIDSAYTFDYKLAYSIQLAGLGDFQHALDAVDDLLTHKPPKNPTSLASAQKRKQSYEFAIDFEKNNPEKNYVFAPKNVGSTINTSEPEYLPSLTIDGKELIFTRRVNNTNEDFYSSTLENGQWSTAKPLAGIINTPMSEAAQNISSDGRWLVFTANNRDNSFGNYDLYMSQFTAQGWGEAINLGRRVNSDQWDSQPCLSPDQQDLYFASRRLGGLGGIDIYVCHRLSNGGWSDPENLGPGINTPGDDQCPFIHADNQTLYFVSNGWPGYGGNDIFVTAKTPDGKWEKPRNLGYPINTIHDEGTLFIAADGKTAYYSSDRSDSKGSNDIYSFELRPDIRPRKTLWVKGKVSDRKTMGGLQSQVELIDLASGQIINRVSTDATGNYFITLPVGKDYAFNVNHPGYLFYSDQYLLSQASPDSVYQKNIALEPIEVDARIVLKNIFFESGKYDLQPTSQVELQKLVQLLNDNPTVKLEISGYTDNVGKPADNLQLSANRAKAVVNYLVSKSISAQRLSAKGYGETKPVADNSTAEGKALNRRTEIRVIAK